MKICKKSVPLDELKRRLARGYFARKYSNDIGYQNSVDIVLLLVDKRLVSCSLCQRKTFTGWLRKFCSAGFLGHYILLWGYSPQKDIFLYSDPASSQEYCTMTSEMLELCRKSRGTDEDLIVVHGLRQPS
ncbi:hypothetical protein GAYE_PCTG75G1625 [Galdieria yellowstonensis]|uniref:Uncharacterized protein n=1 Tax=Galdieria yellowstonensis TaxID=3028027 RepID=A0AAV9I8Y9_9RHOD|nr:hypothetical protein GAYE_PCTG75G1625 [Galdieria yellowstonensis]